MRLVVGGLERIIMTKFETPLDTIYMVLILGSAERRTDWFCVLPSLKSRPYIDTGRIARYEVCLIRPPSLLLILI